MKRSVLLAMLAICFSCSALRAASEAKEPKPGEERTFDVGNGVKMTFCWIPGSNGKFKIGSPKAEQDYIMNKYFDGRRNWTTMFGPSSLDDENEVEIDGVDGFWMAKYPVTQTQYVKLTGKQNPSYFCAQSGGKEKVHGLDTSDFPVEQVSWEDAQQCIKAMATPIGTKKIWLPSEVQWEWAARGGFGNDREFYWGDTLNGDKANVDGIAGPHKSTRGKCLERTSKVGDYEKKALHPWGLCDVVGNVWQWCLDDFALHKDLKGPNPILTTKPSSNRHAIRGGGWSVGAAASRSAYRWSAPADVRSWMIGFRVVLLP